MEHLDIVYYTRSTPVSTLNSVDSQLHPGHCTSGSSSTTGPLVWGAQLGQLFFWICLYVWKWYVCIYIYIYIYIPCIHIYVYIHMYMDYIPNKWWFRRETGENFQDFQVPYWSSASGGLTGCFAEGPNVAASNAFRELAGLGTKLSRTHWRSMSSCDFLRIIGSDQGSNLQGLGTTICDLCQRLIP